MDIPALLDDLDTQGITVTVNGDRLRIVPGSLVSQGLADTLRAHKTELLDYLKGEAARVEMQLSTLNLRVGEPHVPSTQDLLPWASELAEQDIVLPNSVFFVETPLRTITTEQVSYYATIYLKTIVRAQSYQHPDRCWGIFTPEWWKQQEQQAFDALAGLKIALEQRD